MSPVLGTGGAGVGVEVCEDDWVIVLVLLRVKGLDLECTELTVGGKVPSFLNGVDGG